QVRHAGSLDRRADSPGRAPSTIRGLVKRAYVEPLVSLVNSGCTLHSRRDIHERFRPVVVWHRRAHSRTNCAPWIGAAPASCRVPGSLDSSHHRITNDFRTSADAWFTRT